MNMSDKPFFDILPSNERHRSRWQRNSKWKIRRRYRSEARRQLTELEHRSSLVHRLNARFPLLKIIVLIVVITIIILDLTGLTISNVTNPTPMLSYAPMRQHAKITERNPDGKMLVALTFDDGPSPETTPRLLDTLKEKSVLATFFMLGTRAASNPDLVRRAKTEGHEIGSHTMYHQNLILLPADAVQNDLTAAKTTMADITGKEPSLIRPPYGNYNDVVSNLVGTPMIIWSVDTLDWQNKNTGSIVATTMSEIHDGAIILMHDIYPSSVDAVPILIDTLRQNGYEFVTISELAKTRHASLTPGTAYYNFRP